MKLPCAADPVAVPFPLDLSTRSKPIEATGVTDPVDASAKTEGPRRRRKVAGVVKSIVTVEICGGGDGDWVGLDWVGGVVELVG